MKTLTSLLTLAAVLIGTGAAHSAALSTGNYRVPYQNATNASVITPAGQPIEEVDLNGSGTNTSAGVVAAAAGVVRAIMDANAASCATCSNSNNYIWLQHSNGEWSGYFHLQSGTVTGAAGLSVGDNVDAGQYLGNEGNVGATVITKLRFEVAVPNNPANPINLATGTIIGEKRIPIICGIPGNVFLAGNSHYSRDCGAPEFSYGVYRLPYADGTRVFVSRDHLTHTPVPTRLDLVGTGGSAPYAIVAAADGTIRAIVDTNTNSCPSCTSANNYVWIEHPNGEWTKYTHFQRNSVRVKAGLTNGQPVCAGTYLGDEGNIGAASGVHCHFEVGVPTNLTTPFQTSGGFINGFNRIPIFCDVPGNIVTDGNTYTANPCEGSCVPDLLLGSGILYGQQVVMASNSIDSNDNSFRVDTYASLSLRAGDRITLRPGFRAAFNSYLHAAIRSCNQMERLRMCTPAGSILTTTSGVASGTPVPGSISN